MPAVKCLSKGVLEAVLTGIPDRHAYPGRRLNQRQMPSKRQKEGANQSDPQRATRHNSNLIRLR